MTTLRVISDSFGRAPRRYAEGRLSTVIVALAVPMILETVLESLFAIVNVVWVARLGNSAIATVGATEPIMSLILSTAMGIGIAATAIVARRVGEHDEPGANRAAFQGLLLALAVSAAFMMISQPAARAIMALVKPPPIEERQNFEYTKLMLIGSPTLLLLTLSNSIFRAVGCPTVAVRVLAIANGINLLLDPILIYGAGMFPGLGVRGAAVATVLSRAVGVLCQFGMLKSGVGPIKWHLHCLHLEWTTVRTLCRTAFFGVFQFYISDLSWFALVGIISSFGESAVAAYTIAMRVVTFAILPSWGLGNAVATIVGQSLGAGRPARAEQAVWIALRYNLLLLGSAGIMIAISAKRVCELITGRGGGLSALAAWDLRVMGGFVVCYGFSILMAEAFDGAGDTVTPTLVSVAVYWAFQIPGAYVLAFPARLGSGAPIVMIPAAELLYALICCGIFIKGRWKVQQL